MKKIETIWHHILHEALTHNQFKHTQQALSHELGYSLSTVHHALVVPSQNGSIRKEGKFFVLSDFKKLLYYWASVRTFENDIIYQAHSDLSITERQGIVPGMCVYACYTAATNYSGEPPADYNKLYVYIDPVMLPLFRERFPSVLSKQESNVYALKMPENMHRYGNKTTLIQTFVDIWNLRDWFAKDFIVQLEEKINAVLP